jgi:hypothetical protein
LVSGSDLEVGGRAVPLALAWREYHQLRLNLAAGPGICPVVVVRGHVALSADADGGEVRKEGSHQDQGSLSRGL